MRRNVRLLENNVHRPFPPVPLRSPCSRSEYASNRMSKIDNKSKAPKAVRPLEPYPSRLKTKAGACEPSPVANRRSLELAEDLLLFAGIAAAIVEIIIIASVWIVFGLAMFDFLSALL